MRKLLNTLYVTSADSYLSLDGENIVILKDNQQLKRVPLHNLENIVCFNYAGASPALMEACAKHNIPLSFCSEHGRFLATVNGEIKGNVILRRTQYRYADNEAKCLDIGKNILIGKIYNAKWVLERATRDHPQRVDINKLKKVSEFLSNSLNELSNIKTYNGLLGVEGEAASQYFSVFDELILQDKDNFFFRGRNRRPPLDNVNALLSFSYTLLAVETAAAASVVGLDPYVGFLHKDRPGRKSLALDLMEELRSVFADRFVLALINNRQVDEKGFDKMENGAVIMKDDTRKIVINAWHSRKQEKIMHPFLKEKIEWGLVPYSQALLLARYLRGDLDAYPPFFWK